MKQRLIHLMKHDFASQWMEMIIMHRGDFGVWRRLIKEGKYNIAIAQTSLVGAWLSTPQGYSYWQSCTYKLGQDML